MNDKRQTIDLSTIALRHCSLCSAQRDCVGLSFDDGERYLYICWECASTLSDVLAAHDQEEKWLQKFAARR